MILALLAFVLLVLVVVWRARQKNRRAGLTSSAPVFHIDPPGGRVRRSSKDVL